MDDVTLPSRQGPAYTGCIGWQFLLGAVLIVLGFVLLALVDAPRRAMHGLRRLGWWPPRWLPRAGERAAPSPPGRPVTTTVAASAAAPVSGAPADGPDARRASGGTPAAPPEQAPAAASRQPAPAPSASSSPQPADSRSADLWVTDALDRR